MTGYRGDVLEVAKAILAGPLAQNLAVQALNPAYGSVTVSDLVVIFAKNVVDDVNRLQEPA